MLQVNISGIQVFDNTIKTLCVCICRASGVLKGHAIYIFPQNRRKIFPIFYKLLLCSHSTPEVFFFSEYSHQCWCCEHPFIVPKYVAQMWYKINSTYLYYLFKKSNILWGSVIAKVLNYFCLCLQIAETHPQTVIMLPASVLPEVSDSKTQNSELSSISVQAAKAINSSNSYKRAPISRKNSRTNRPHI